jgi:hypothetical protein
LSRGNGNISTEKLVTRLVTSVKTSLLLDCGISTVQRSESVPKVLQIQSWASTLDEDQVYAEFWALLWYKYLTYVNLLIVRSAKIQGPGS